MYGAERGVGESDLRKKLNVGEYRTLLLPLVRRYMCKQSRSFYNGTTLPVDRQCIYC